MTLVFIGVLILSPTSTYTSSWRSSFVFYLVLISRMTRVRQGLLPMYRSRLISISRLVRELVFANIVCWFIHSFMCSSCGLLDEVLVGIEIDDQLTSQPTSSGHHHHLHSGCLIVHLVLPTRTSCSVVDRSSQFPYGRGPKTFQARSVSVHGHLQDQLGCLCPQLRCLRLLHSSGEAVLHICSEASCCPESSSTSPRLLEIQESLCGIGQFISCCLHLLARRNCISEVYGCQLLTDGFGRKPGNVPQSGLHSGRLYRASSHLFSSHWDLISYQSGIVGTE